VITQPQQIVFGQEMYPTIWLKAAYMMQQIVKTPVFVDGSKRTAMLVVQTFLTANGYDPTPDFFEDVQAFTIEVTQTSNTEAVMATIADWLASVFTER
jgi:death-on-curing protein